jgi:molybdenum cofactor guanylyltransferase
MGQEKAFLELGGKTLLSRALELARSVTTDVRIVGSTAEFAAFGRVVEDVYLDRGPLGGIHAALRDTQSQLNLFLAVDMPFITPQFLMYLVARSRESDAVVTAVHASGYWQPLCAVYRKSFLSEAERALAQGKNKIDALFPQINTKAIDENELAARGFLMEMFRNLNTPEDRQAAERALNPPTANHS